MTQGLARNGFDMDLLEGQAREAAFSRAISGARVEHKFDAKARQTGNVYIEYRQWVQSRPPGIPSGIAVTEADYWTIEVDDEVWVTLRTSLLKALSRRCLRDGKTVVGGDNNETQGVLVPVEWLVRPWRYLGNEERKEGSSDSNLTLFGGGH